MSDVYKTTEQNYIDARNSLMKATEEISKSIMSQQEYDRTEVCVIVDDTKASEGVYIVELDNVTFEVFGEQNKYFKNQSVRVNILNNDYSKKKFIIGEYSYQNNIYYNTTGKDIITLFESKYLKQTQCKIENTNYLAYKIAATGNLLLLEGDKNKQPECKIQTLSSPNSDIQYLDILEVQPTWDWNEDNNIWTLKELNIILLNKYVERFNNFPINIQIDLYINGSNKINNYHFFYLGKVIDVQNIPLENLSSEEKSNLTSDYTLIVDGLNGGEQVKPLTKYFDYYHCYYYYSDIITNSINKNAVITGKLNGKIIPSFYNNNNIHIDSIMTQELCFLDFTKENIYICEEIENMILYTDLILSFEYMGDIMYNDKFILEIETEENFRRHKSVIKLSAEKLVGIKNYYDTNDISKWKITNLISGNIHTQRIILKGLTQGKLRSITVSFDKHSGDILTISNLLIKLGNSVINQDKQLQIWTNDTKIVSSDDKSINMLWYNKNNKNQYIGFSDGNCTNFSYGNTYEILGSIKDQYAFLTKSIPLEFRVDSGIVTITKKNATNGIDYYYKYYKNMDNVIFIYGINENLTECTFKFSHLPYNQYNEALYLNLKNTYENLKYYKNSLEIITLNGKDCGKVIFLDQNNKEKIMYIGLDETSLRTSLALQTLFQQIGTWFTRYEGTPNGNLIDQAYYINYLLQKRKDSNVWKEVQQHVSGNIDVVYQLIQQFTTWFTYLYDAENPQDGALYRTYDLYNRMLTGYNKKVTIVNEKKIKLVDFYSQSCINNFSTTGRQETNNYNADIDLTITTPSHWKYCNIYIQSEKFNTNYYHMKINESSHTVEIEGFYFEHQGIYNDESLAIYIEEVDYDEIELQFSLRECLLESCKALRILYTLIKAFSSFKDNRMQSCKEVKPIIESYLIKATNLIQMIDEILQIELSVDNTLLQQDNPQYYYINDCGKFQDRDQKEDTFCKVLDDTIFDNNGENNSILGHINCRFQYVGEKNSEEYKIITLDSAGNNDEYGFNNLPLWAPAVSTKNRICRLRLSYFKDIIKNNIFENLMYQYQNNIWAEAMDFTQTLNNLDNRYSLYWYISDDSITKENADEFGGVGWRKIPYTNQGLPIRINLENSHFLIDNEIYFNVIKYYYDKETMENYKLKAILFYNHDKYESNEIEFQTQQDLNEEMSLIMSDIQKLITDNIVYNLRQRNNTYSNTTENTYISTTSVTGTQINTPYIASAEYYVIDQEDNLKMPLDDYIIQLVGTGGGTIDLEAAENNETGW